MPDGLGSFIAVIVLALSVISISTLIWLIAAACRLIADATIHRRIRALRFKHHEVAIMVAAHNEELVIGDTIRAAARHVPLEHIFIASDGSSDRTEEIARDLGVNVVPISPNRGKAGALKYAIAHFAIPERFRVLLLLDADTRLRPDYLETGLPLFNDRSVVAVAGRATTMRYPRPSTRMGRFLTDYRERSYVAMQFLHKFGQAAKPLNAVSIVPGFASMYRTDILDRIDIDAPGLAIEDFNMTFEVHAQKLGRIAFHPKRAIAETQDPTTMGEYTKQVRRWSLGFFQTVRRHGIQLGFFWAVVALAVFEILVSSVVFVLMIPALVFTFVAWLVATFTTGNEGIAAAATFVSTILPWWVILLGFVVPDFIMTVIAAILSRRLPSLHALLFPLMRIVDATLCLRAAGAAVWGRSDGRWVSPTRRQIDAPPVDQALTNRSEAQPAGSVI